MSKYVLLRSSIRIVGLKSAIWEMLQKCWCHCQGLWTWLDTEWIWKCYHSSAQCAMMLRTKKTSNVKRVVKQNGWVISVLTIVQSDRGEHCVCLPPWKGLCVQRMSATHLNHTVPHSTMLDLRYTQTERPAYSRPNCHLN